MNEDKTSPEELSNPDISHTDLNLAPTEEAPSKFMGSEQSTVITSGEGLIGDLSARSIPAFSANSSSSQTPLFALFKWFGPVALVSIIFLIWSILNHIRQQKTFDEISEVNSLLLYSMDALTHNQVSDSAISIQKLLRIVPDNTQLQEIYVELNRKINNQGSESSSPPLQHSTMRTPEKSSPKKPPTKVSHKKNTPKKK